MAYSIVEHRHRFAAWAAASAASVMGCRFSVQQGRAILEQAGIGALIETPAALPAPSEMDAAHRKWRELIIEAAASRGLVFTHGVAAKLLNVYLKSAFVCGGHHEHPSVKSLHPPIDSVLVKALCDENMGGLRAEWLKARRTRWSKLSGEGYEAIISAIRRGMPNAALWEVEQHWRGYR
jgi:hypothetical protein